MSDINRLIAEAKGYTVKPHKPRFGNGTGCGFMLCRPDLTIDSESWSLTELDVWDCVPDYEHDLNAAWELTADFAPNWFVTTVNWGHMGNVALMCQLICAEWLEWKNIPLPTPAPPIESEK